MWALLDRSLADVCFLIVLLFWLSLGGCLGSSLRAEVTSIFNFMS